MTEDETRAEHIDPALKAAGWGVLGDSRVRRNFAIAPGRIEGAGRRAPPLRADYVLEFRNTALAVIEAKAFDKALTEGVAQAKDYAQKLQVRFAYASNGRGIYAIDMRDGAEGQAPQFPSPQELWDRTFATRNAWRERFAAVPCPDKSGSWQIRYYQQIAVERVLEAIAQGRERVLLTLATGTGKTSIAFQIAWKLFRARWNLADWKSDGAPSRSPRILFLADRNNLADQAFNDFNAFAAFEETALVRIAPDEIRKKARVPTNGSVFFTIFQTFLSGPGEAGFDSAQPAVSRCLSEVEGNAYFGEYPPDFFDFIVIDECHRGGANDESTWRDILDYFAPAVQLGLTATPKRRDNVDTYAYFGEPVYVYSLKDGINDGYLTPFRVRQIATTLDDYVWTPDDTVVEGEIQTGKRYAEADFNRSIEIEARERKRVNIFMDMIDQREKTLVFCATQAHALLVRDLINQVKTSTDPDYCHRVTAGDGALGNRHLEDFRDNEKTIPTILTTSQKLSTGVDARNVRNIVLLRPVGSMIEFKQIVGRGTRLYEGKDYFTIYDFVRAHQHFSDPEWDGDPISPETCDQCGSYPCICEAQPLPPCKHCGKRPCECPCEVCGKHPCACERKPRKTKVKLADGKERNIQHMTATSFWHPDGTPMSAQQFMQALFGKLPEFFRDEDELRRLWGDPATRKTLLAGLAGQGFGRDQLAEMQTLIDAQSSDLFDVLAYVAWASDPRTRSDRAHQAIMTYPDDLNVNQRGFLNFVLGEYVNHGVDELDQEKLPPLLQLKYHAIADAAAELGSAERIRALFVGFQKYLYQPGARA